MYLWELVTRNKSIILLKKKKKKEKGINQYFGVLNGISSSNVKNYYLHREDR